MIDNVTRLVPFKNLELKTQTSWAYGFDSFGQHWFR